MSLIHQILLRITSKFRARAVMHCILLTFGTVCAMRTVALRTNYGAPLQVFFHLQQYPIYSNRTGEINVCMGDEWFRFPSSFFLPSPQYRLHYLKQTFSGVVSSSGRCQQLPRQFFKHCPFNRCPTWVDCMSSNRFLDCIDSNFLVCHQFKTRVFHCYHAFLAHMSVHKVYWVFISLYFSTLSTCVWLRDQHKTNLR